MKRKASAVWRGEGPTGSGNLTSPSGVLNDTPYSAKMRFEDDEGRSGTNPEELIAAAHAGCYSMALAFGLGGAGHAPEEISTSADLTMEKEGSGWSITAIHLTVKARVPGISEEDFRKAAAAAKDGCPVSKVLRATITLDAALV